MALISTPVSERLQVFEKRKLNDKRAEEPDKEELGAAIGARRKGAQSAERNETRATKCAPAELRPVCRLWPKPTKDDNNNATQQSKLTNESNGSQAPQEKRETEKGDDINELGDDETFNVRRLVRAQEGELGTVATDASVVGKKLEEGNLGSLPDWKRELLFARQSRNAQFKQESTRLNGELPISRRLLRRADQESLTTLF